MTAQRLRDATSPYLQQHADNPVDWWPWCADALAAARREDKPILLSIGYSACHWCHVMAHESFEDPDTAEVMNRLFVNVKVDREERPDLDQIYQTAHQLLARRAGGWPLTVFLTPDDHAPFFAGTYFPPQPRHGLPAFRDLLVQIERAYRDQRAAIGEQNQALRDALVRIEGDDTGGGALNEAPLHAALAQLAAQFDAHHGGFGDAPKFPHPATLRFLLREGLRRDNANARDMALHTLQCMAEGGINDHLGGGFCRYSVDDRWMIPHFEKMLYDNAQLLAVYAEAWAGCGQRPLFRHVCERTAEWIVDGMQHADGGYFASLDADSEGEEGRFYVWTPDQVRDLLTADEYAVFAPRFGLDRPPNFEGRWHLHGFVPAQEVAAQLDMPAVEVRRLLRSAREKLVAARAARVPPGRDEKILASWNALAIRGMAIAGRLLDRDDWLDSAQHALEHLRALHWRDGRLLATSRDGRVRLNAYLDDHAYLIDAVLEMLQARWDSAWLAFATELGDRLLTTFEDRSRGGFFFTSDDHEALLHRPRPFGDDATPSGNGVAVEALTRLAALTGEVRFQQAAERTLHAAWAAIERAPHAHFGLLEGLRQWLSPPETVIVRGPGDLADWRRQAAAVYRPGMAVFPVPAEAAGLPELLTGKVAIGGRATAYRCRGMTCEAPFHLPDDL